MSKRTICCKMAPTPAMVDQLSATCSAFAAACNAALCVAVEHDLSNKIKLQRECYYTLRSDFALSANLAIQSIRRVATAMTRCKGKRKRPKRFRPNSVGYDARVFAYREKDETVSLTTTTGRIHVPLVLGEFQRRALAGKKPSAATLIRKGRGFAIHIVVEDDDDASPGDGMMGVDCGIRNTAATNHATLHNGQNRQNDKAKRARVRASLQSKGTRGARRVMKRLSGRERRHIRHDNHCLSKALVDEAKTHRCGTIRMERLTGIRQRTRVWNKHTNRMIAGWSFGELQGFAAYKGKRAGIDIEYVNPAYTSRTCSTCGERGVRRQDVFRCTTCGEIHADINAARMIAMGGVARDEQSSRRKPARIDRKCEIRVSHDAVESRLL